MTNLTKGEDKPLVNQTNGVKHDGKSTYTPDAPRKDYPEGTSPALTKDWSK